MAMKRRMARALLAGAASGALLGLPAALWLSWALPTWLLPVPALVLAVVGLASAPLFLLPLQSRLARSALAGALYWGFLLGFLLDPWSAPLGALLGATSGALTGRLLLP